MLGTRLLSPLLPNPLPGSARVLGLRNRRKYQWNLSASSAHRLRVQKRRAVECSRRTAASDAPSAPMRQYFRRSLLRASSGVEAQPDGANAGGKQQTQSVVRAQRELPSKRRAEGVFLVVLLLTLPSRISRREALQSIPPRPSDPPTTPDKPRLSPPPLLLARARTSSSTAPVHRPVYRKASNRNRCPAASEHASSRLASPPSSHQLRPRSARVLTGPQAVLRHARHADLSCSQNGRR